MAKEDYSGITIRVHKTLIAQLKAVCEQDRRTVSNYVSLLIEKHLRERGVQ